MTPVELVKMVEGCKPKAYPDPATGGRPWTIGYGHTGPETHLGLTWTQAECEAALAQDLLMFEKVVDSAVKVPITPGERAALVSFAYNEGAHRLSDPNCRILPLLNAGDHLSAAGQFLHWTLAAGRPLLCRRRQIEVEIFLADLGVI